MMRRFCMKGIQAIFSGVNGTIFGVIWNRLFERKLGDCENIRQLTNRCVAMTMVTCFCLHGSVATMSDHEVESLAEVTSL